MEGDGDEMSKQLENLRPFTEYNVSVLASTVEGAGPANSTLFTTDEKGLLLFLFDLETCIMFHLLSSNVMFHVLTKGSVHTYIHCYRLYVLR